MKKIIAITAVALATSTMCAAAEVSVYGQIDSGIAYVKGDGGSGKTTMESSVDIASKWGFTGSESFGNGNYVKFILENGFETDTGTMKWNRLFGREALVIVGGSWGELALGRTGTSTGTYGMWAKMGINPMQTNFLDATLGGVFTSIGMASNSITYQVKPTKELTLTAQYVNGDDETKDWDDDNHMYQLGALYKAGTLSVGFIYGLSQYGNQTSSSIAPHNASMSHNVMMSASQNFGSARWYVAYQHVWDSRVIGGGSVQFSAKELGATLASTSKEGFDADAAMIGFNMPALAGKVHGAAKVVHAKWKGLEAAGQDTSGTRWVLSAKYRYDLSKRSDVYILTSYAKGTGMFKTTESKATRFVIAAGVSHRF